MLELSVRIESFPLRKHFTISRGSKTETIVVVAELSDGAVRGWGECGPNVRYGETPEAVCAQIAALGPAIADGLDRDALQDVLPPGAARNALDCAFLDHEAKASGTPVADRLALAPLHAVQSAFTLSADSPDAMARDAAENADRPILKLKLTGDDDLARVRAVHGAAPHARLVIDANEAWTPGSYEELVPRFAGLGVELIEQPFPAGDDEPLRSLARPIPVCADESFRDAASLPALSGKYDVVNIKLDKTGGLTSALAAAAAAREAGLSLMVGCMVGTSLAMAPAFLIAQCAGFVDLDGPLLLRTDREPPLPVHGSELAPPPRELWG